MRRAPKLLAGRVLGAVACLLLFVGFTPARAAGSEGGYTEYTTPTPSSLPAGLTRGSRTSVFQ